MRTDRPCTIAILADDLGSPGLALALAKRLAPVQVASDVTLAGGSEILVVVGSSNPRRHRQADRIGVERGVALLRAPVERIDDPGSILRDIAQAAAGSVVDERFDVVMATGGDTMEAILDGLDISAFEILQELEAGFPLGRASLGNGRELLIAMKAGGSGDDDTLRRAIARLRACASLSEKVLR
ncbi:uncharacterized protein YgbK (DUF1537 family) [Bradyrhizobium sp. USDA 4472]